MRFVVRVANNVYLQAQLKEAMNDSFQSGRVIDPGEFPPQLQFKTGLKNYSMPRPR